MHPDREPPRQSGNDDLQAGLTAAAAWLASHGVSVPPLEGKLLRPAVAYALLEPGLRADVDEGFWRGALGIQMVHEASLLHDDILDDASTRRGEPTVAARKGVAAALVLGDQFLTASYRAAAASGSPAFLDQFIVAVERTVAGEVAQGRSCGKILDDGEYQCIITGKSGELFGAAAVLAATRSGSDTVEARALGCAVGSLYQMVDDFLDYCPDAQTGKEPYQDYRQRKCTFLLEVAGIEDFSLATEEVHRILHTPDPTGETPLQRGLRRLEAGRDRVLAEAQRVFGHQDALEALLHGWLAAARRGLNPASAGHRAPAAATGSEASAAALSPSPPSAEAVVASAARAVGRPGAWGRYFGHHSKSFRFAARLFPPGPRADVEGVYAFCRFTDDLVDEADAAAPQVRERVEAWRGLSRAAYEGAAVDIPLLDRVMGRMEDSGAPFHYVDDLLTGVAMDLEPTDYRTDADLEIYTYRVASVVGGWITELFGLHDPELLGRAYALGHGMQLTNILRDVGEDWRRGRLYLPAETLTRLGIDRDDVARVSETGRVDETWVGAMEHFMARADRYYASAEEAIPALPTFYRRPVAVAARVYRGIHDEIRRNGYDNGTRRAYTSLPRKLRLASGGLWSLRGMPAPGFQEQDFALAHQDS